MDVKTLIQNPHHPRNHDNPSGAGNLSAVDVLSTCNLVNYFDKHVRGTTPTL